MSKKKHKAAQAKKEAKIDEMIINLHERLSETIKDPQALIVATARIYAQSVVMSYKNNHDETKVPNKLKKA